MNNKLETMIIITLLITTFFSGYMYREVNGQYNADRYLTKHIQDLQDQYEIQYQELAVCKWERNKEQSIILDTTIMRGMLS